VPTAQRFATPAPRASSTHRTMPPLTRGFIKSALVHLAESPCSIHTLSMSQEAYSVGVGYTA